MSDCTHQATAERRRKRSDNTVVIAVQCLQCGRRMHEVSKVGRILAKLDWFDESLIAQWDAKQKAEYEANQQQWRRDNQARTGHWWESYKEYLNSDQWRQVRMAVLDRDRLCQKCFVLPATEAHHLTYDTFSKRGFSYPAECVGLCHDCHAEETEASRRRLSDASQAALPYRDA